MQPSPRTRRRALASLRLIAALALLATGGVHLEQYLADDFSVLPTIGPLFLLNFLGGTALGLYFLVPAREAQGWGRRALDLLAAWAGIALAGASLVALFVSEHTPLFGFMERGYRLEIVVAIVAEVVAVLALSALVALRRPSTAPVLATSPRPSNYTAS